jgi:hypothetical protein
MTIIIFSILFVVSILVGIGMYFLGVFQGEKKASTTVLTVASTMNSILEKALLHSADQSATWAKVLEQKDIVITSFAKENAELRKALDDMNTLENMLDEEDDEDEEIEEEKATVGVLAAVAPKEIQPFTETKTAAHVALDLHSRLQAVKDVLHMIALPEAAHKLITDILDTDKNQNANLN